MCIIDSFYTNGQDGYIDTAYVPVSVSSYFSQHIESPSKFSSSKFFFQNLKIKLNTIAAMAAMAAMASFTQPSPEVYTCSAEGIQQKLATIQWAAPTAPIAQSSYPDKKPFQLAGAIEVWSNFDITAVIGREFESVL